MRNMIRHVFLVLVIAGLAALTSGTATALNGTPQHNSGARTDYRADAVTAEGDMSAHTFTVFVPGQPPRVMPASFGKPGRETPVGTFPIMEKDRTIIFDSRTIGIPLSSPEGYYLTGEFAERLTSGGVFVHSAPWSVDQQGNANVSHGCVNLAPDDAEWYYNVVHVGDPVTIHW